MPPCMMRPEMPMGISPDMCRSCPPDSAVSAATENIDCYPVGMTYVPWLKWQEVYALDVALEMGTIFPDLFKPFMMGGCR